MRGFERRRVIHAIAGHRDDFAVGLQGLDDAELLLGHDACEDACCPRAPSKFGIIEIFNRITSQHLGSVEPRQLRDGARGRRVIVRDHHDPYPSRVAFTNGGRDARPQWIGEPG
jgi:hypothetical protein